MMMIKKKNENGKQQKQQEKESVLFSPKQLALILSPHQPHKSPVVNKQKQQQGRRKSSNKCCASCLGMGSSLSLSQSPYHPPSKSNHQLMNNVENKKVVQHQHQHGESPQKATDKRLLERVQEYLSPRASYPQYRNVIPNLTLLITQAKFHGWYIDPREIELKEQIGRGSTAVIYKGSWKGLDVAVKCMYPNFFISNENGVAFFAQEIETLSRQRHPFVLRLVGACLEPPEHGWVVTEFLSMTLVDWLHGDRRRKMERSIPLPSLAERVAKAIEIAQAMQYLHEQKPKLIHRDLKPSNILMDDAMHVRVADFGAARFLGEGEAALTGETGTCVYMAPEVIRCEPYDEKCDVYSYAIILNELITGQHPYIETDYGPTQIALEVANRNLRPKLPEEKDQLEELINLIRLSWDDDTSVRPSFATITCTLRKIQEELMRVD